MPNAIDGGQSASVDNSEVAQPAANAKQPVKTSETVSKTSAIILVLAIGVHALFEGIAFGLQDSIDKAGQLAAGILIHKTAAAVSLGGAFARTGFTLCQICIFLGIFALTTPVGILIGMAISESNAVIDVVFLGLSGGTFIYVACSEIITAEFDKGSYQWAKMLLVLLGGTIIAILWFFGEHHHHGGEEGHEGHGHRLL